jgi:hypothetical protein
MEDWACTVDVVCRLRSIGAELEGPAALAPAVEGGGAEDEGVVNVFFTLEKREVMRA